MEPATVLTPQQKNHFDVFGYLVLRQAFSHSEMAAITRTIEHVWAEDPQPVEQDERRSGGIVESRPELTALVTDERLYPIIEGLLGSELQWVGSEGNLSSSSTIGWHPDRKYYTSGEEHWMDFAQLKLMIYLDPVDRDSGCLRVIPGSHRMPFHRNLADQELSPEAKPFSVIGPEIPCMALESKPGDIVLFDHCIWHASFGGGSRRRYLAMKFAQRPTAPHHIESLHKYGTGVFAPAAEFTHHSDPRIRSMSRVPN
jgi:ectoine hydroxylase-related dioxygenase (phytanoyl-CoA dioxygenase family)